MKHRNKKGQQWASDENASSLLEGIIDETETAARQEEAALNEAIARKERAETEQQAAREAQRRALAKQRIDAEEVRQQKIATRRTEQMQALQGITPEATEPTTPQSAEDMHRQMSDLRQMYIDQQLGQQLTPHAPTPAPAPTPQRSASSPPHDPVTTTPSRARYVALGVLAILIVGAGSLIAALTTNTYSPDQTAYTKVVLVPVDQLAPVTGESVTPVERAAPAAAPEATPEKKRPGKKIKRPKRPKRPRTNTKRPKKPKFQLDLDSDDDIFGGT